MRTWSTLVASAVIGLSTWVTQAAAEVFDVIPAQVLVTTVSSDATGAEIMVDVQLKEGWKTYYRSDGEDPYGIDNDMKLHWTGDSAARVQSHQIVWPDPETFDFYGQETLGYTQPVVLPVYVEFTPGDQSPEMLEFDIEIYFCSTICVRELLSTELIL